MNLWKRLKGAFLPRARAAAGYEAAAATRRTSGWTPPTSDINTLVFGSADTLGARARDMVRRNPWATNALDAFVANCIGTGIKPQSLHSEAAEQIQALWLRWTDEADASALTDFYGLQALACRAVMEAGECIIRLRPRLPKDGLSVPLQLQVLEAEHLPTNETRKLPNGNYVRAGIEFNGIGKRVAYYLYREHPGDTLNPLATTELVRVPAESVLHLFRPLRPGQLRGQPWLTQVLIKLNELDQYDDAEVVRKKTAAMFAGFVTKNAPEDPILNEDDADSEAAGTAVAGLEPGTMQVLLPGEDVKFSSPADVGASYETFMRVQLRSIAAGMGITYEQLTGDLTGVNYSSIRAGLLEFRRRCEQFQHQVIVFQMCRPIWRAWIQAAVGSGALPHASDLAPYYDVKWIPPGFAWVDPLKDIKAQIMAVRAGFKSRAEVVSEQGYDAEQIDAEIAADNARADELGLAYDSDPRKELANEAAAASGDAGV